MDPHYVLALAETATFQHAEPLKDAMSKHISRKAAIRVKIPVRFQTLVFF
jgi:hypothetical protein